MQECFGESLIGDQYESHILIPFSSGVHDLQPSIDISETMEPESLIMPGLEMFDALC